ncbi:MAG: hypothetical protein AAGF12_29375 [Myxococcota bacterium]
MGVNRVFLPQEALDTWLTEGRVDVEGETMTLKPEGQRFLLKSALHFVDEVGGGEDEAALIGRVKDLNQVTELGGEHYADSVLLGECAYQVIEGFVGEPIVEEEAFATGSDLAAATRAAVGDTEPEDELEALTRFFLS